MLPFGGRCRASLPALDPPYHRLLSFGMKSSQCTLRAADKYAILFLLAKCRTDIYELETVAGRANDRCFNDAILEYLDKTDFFELSLSRQDDIATPLIEILLSDELEATVMGKIRRLTASETTLGKRQHMSTQTDDALGP